MRDFNFFEAGISALISFGVTVLLGVLIIPALKRFNLRQTTSEFAPSTHKKKQNTPTMGGIMFIIGISFGFFAGIFLLWKNNHIKFDGIGQKEFTDAVSGFLMAVFFGLIGFMDDFLKVKRHKNDGLSETQKVILQIMVVSAFFAGRIISGNTNTTITIPFFGQIDLWYFYYIIIGLLIIYLVNAVNLTDGLDGLCSSIMVIYAASYLIISSMLGFKEIPILASAVGGGCLGFLIWNFHPAKVFMGDFGSMFLGGAVCAFGVVTHTEVIMVIAGAVFIFEALTVLIQRTYFKLSGGKRILKSSPYHHSLELSGYKEPRIVMSFSIAAVIAGALAIFLSAKGIKL